MLILFAVEEGGMEGYWGKACGFLSRMRMG